MIAPQKNLRLELLFGLPAALFLATVGLLGKLGSEAMSTPMLVWSRQLVGLIALQPFLMNDLRRDGIAFFKTTHLRFQIACACTELGAGFLLFFALAHLPLAETMTLNNTRALFIPIYSWLILKHHHEAIIWICLAIGFAGVVLILEPGIEIFRPASLIALGAGAVGGGAYLMIRRLDRVEPANRISFYYFFVSALITSTLLIWAWQSPSLKSGMLMLGIGISAALYQLCLTHAYRYGRASVVGGLLQISLAFSLLYQWLFFGSAVTWTVMTGMVLVAFSSIFILLATRPLHD